MKENNEALYKSKST